ncbi:hypothetical protein B0T22DRAFT_477256 [Podospora appendiculata]|uniref:F-box domain-containing protein n=1 Tax=Podospora appendiculata TaxID=314037 RepID=A0AAE1CH92_9PEZI|nr:hypothetical protein B0T22DRAFT_477256 [Podospora appendiculata]
MAHIQKALPQQQSQFYRLPVEIRVEVYEKVFALTEFSFGSTAGSCHWDSTGCTRSQEARPRSNRLALLRVCKAMARDIKKNIPNWPDRRGVLFDFEDTKVMLEKLATIPTATLRSIRHVRFRATPLPLVIYPGLQATAPVEFRCTVDPAGALKQLHGLSLDRLTVVESPGLPQAQYDMVNRLVAEGNGWRELRFISNTSEMLGYTFAGDDGAHTGERYHRRPQPSTWQTSLNARDGLASAPSVTIYRSTVRSAPNTVLDPRTRSVYEQSPVARPGEQDPELEDPGLLSPDERDKEMLVVVRRGGGVHCEQHQLPAMPTTWDTLTEDIADIEIFNRS